MPSDTCPVCQLYDRLAVAALLMHHGADVMTRAGGVMPAGYGGTIPLARRRIGEALAHTGAVARMVPGMHVAHLGRRLEQLHVELGGWQTPASLRDAATEALECSWWAYQVAGTHYAHAKAGST